MDKVVKINVHNKTLLNFAIIIVSFNVFANYSDNNLIYLQDEIEQRCPQALNLGLVRRVGNHVMFHCQPLQELSAAKHIIQWLETGELLLNYCYSCYLPRNAQYKDVNRRSVAIKVTVLSVTDVFAAE